MSRYPRGKEPCCPICQRQKIHERRAERCQRCAQRPGWHLAPETPAIGATYEHAWLEWQRYIGMAQERYAGPPTRPVQIGRQRILIASDFHVPFQHRAAVAALFAQATDVDLAVLAGDLNDFYSISRFLKYESVPIERELAELTLLIEQASQTWPRVILLEGNHGKPRFEKQVLDKLSPEMVNVVRFLAGGDLSVLRAIARRYPNVEVRGTKVDRHDVDWFVQIHDLLVCHAEKFSRVPGSALRSLEEWFADQEQALGLAPWRVLIQAHTHQLSWLPWHAEKLLIESGCLCETQGYQLQAKVSGRPQRRGWITLEQRDGKTDLNSIRIHWYDAETHDARPTVA